MTPEESVVVLWLVNNAPRVNDKPLLRLVWSNDQFEVRRGIVCHYFGNLKISESEEIQRLRKYSYIQDRWVLEMWLGPEAVRTEEIPETAQGSYEPIYVFESAKGDALPVNLQVVQLILSRLLKPASSPELIKSRLFDELHAKETRADAHVMSAIDTTDIQSLLHNKEAGLVPSNHWAQSPNLKEPV